MRVVRLYEEWNKPDQATAWKVKLGLRDLPADVYAPAMSESTKRFDCDVVAIDEVLSFLPREDAGYGATARTQLAPTALASLRHSSSERPSNRPRI